MTTSPLLKVASGLMCAKCGALGTAPHADRPGCVNTCPNRHPETETMNDTCNPGRPRPEQPTIFPGDKMQTWPMLSQPCATSGSPYPVVADGTQVVVCDPRHPEKVFGSAIPLDRFPDCRDWREAVKRLCYVEFTLRIPSTAAAGVFRFRCAVKWWMQIQSLLNLGDQDDPTFSLTSITYGQSNYAVTFQEFSDNGTPITTDHGIDVRRWNQGVFMPHNYPMPACGLNDPITLEFTNITNAAQTGAIVMGGPAVLQIG